VLTILKGLEQIAVLFCMNKQLG